MYIRSQYDEYEGTRAAGLLELDTVRLKTRLQEIAGPGQETSGMTPGDCITFVFTLFCADLTNYI